MSACTTTFNFFEFTCFPRSRSIDRVTFSSLFALMSDYDFVGRVADVTYRYPGDNRYVLPPYR